MPKKTTGEKGINEQSDMSGNCAQPLQGRWRRKRRVFLSQSRNLREFGKKKSDERKKLKRGNRKKTGKGGNRKGSSCLLVGTERANRSADHIRKKLAKGEITVELIRRIRKRLP